MQEINEVKKDFTTLIKELKLESSVETMLLDLISTYNGADHAAFFETLLYLINLLHNYEELKIKAEAYDQIIKVKKEYQETVEKIKKEVEDEEDDPELPLATPTTDLTNTSDKQSSHTTA